MTLKFWWKSMMSALENYGAYVILCLFFWCWRGDTILFLPAGCHPYTCAAAPSPPPLPGDERRPLCNIWHGACPSTSHSLEVLDRHFLRVWGATSRDGDHKWSFCFFLGISLSSMVFQIKIHQSVLLALHVSYSKWCHLLFFRWLSGLNLTILPPV